MVNRKRLLVCACRGKNEQCVCTLKEAHACMLKSQCRHGGHTLKKDVIPCTNDSSILRRLFSKKKMDTRFNGMAIAMRTVSVMNFTSTKSGCRSDPGRVEVDRQGWSGGQVRAEGLEKDKK